jgi:Ca2+-binding EF-hand superfamily protein
MIVRQMLRLQLGLHAAQHEIAKLMHVMGSKQSSTQQMAMILAMVQEPVMYIHAQWKAVIVQIIILLMV